LGAAALPMPVSNSKRDHASDVDGPLSLSLVACNCAYYGSSARALAHKTMPRMTPIITKLGSVWVTIEIQLLWDRFAG